jgi:hypothetical protein
MGNRDGWDLKGEDMDMSEYALQVRIGSLILSLLYAFVFLRSVTGKVKNPFVNVLRFFTGALALVCAVRVFIHAVWFPLENLAYKYPFNLPLWLIVCCILIPLIGVWLREKFR